MNNMAQTNSFMETAQQIFFVWLCLLSVAVIAVILEIAMPNLKGNKPFQALKAAAITFFFIGVWPVLILGFPRMIISDAWNKVVS